MDMGQKIYELRTQKGMTLEELGNKIGVGKSTVRKWENGMIANMKRDKILKVSEALNTSPAYLMGWEDNLDNFEDGSSKSDFVVDLLSNAPLTEHVKKLQLLNEEHQQTIFDNIDYWYDKEGH